jgi:hypothetical protein
VLINNKPTPSCKGCKLSTLGLLSQPTHVKRGLLLLELTFGFEEQAITPNLSTKLETKPNKGLSLKG